MEPRIIGKKYDKIAKWWQDQHYNSKYGVKQLRRALAFCSDTDKATALDVGCGAGGRFTRILKRHVFAITGIDISAEMINLAKQNHPSENFFVADICRWNPEQKFDFIVAWDSIFHLPLSEHQTVFQKLCDLLNDNGVLIYTLGDSIGEHQDNWHDDTFHYSSIGINENLKILSGNGVTCKHLELDQFPQNHVYIIGVKSVVI